MTVVTISRQMCSLGDEIAQSLARRLGWEIITREKLICEILPKIASKNDLYMLSESPKSFLLKTPSDITYLEFIKLELEEILKTKSLILLGFGSQLLFSNNDQAFHIRITSPMNFREERLKQQYKVSSKEALTILKTSDRRQTRFISAVYNTTNIFDIMHYDLIINTKGLTADDYSASIFTMINEYEKRREIIILDEMAKVKSNQTSSTIFKNQEEYEFAQILDSYNIEWTYEPKTFPIEWDFEGNVKLAFTPDFYLTKLDLYLELTIMNQKYVTLKNKKAKKLREIYPGINVRVIYKKDFQSLLDRFSEI